MEGGRDEWWSEGEGEMNGGVRSEKGMSDEGRNER